VSWCENFSSRRRGASRLVNLSIARQERLARQIVKADLQMLGLKLPESAVGLLLSQKGIQEIEQAGIAFLYGPGRIGFIPDALTELEQLRFLSVSVESDTMLWITASRRRLEESRASI
jgi:hypothetical protein